MKTRHILMAAAIVLAVAGQGRADFVLTGDEVEYVHQWHSLGVLWDFSYASVASNGCINWAYVNDDARLRVNLGRISNAVNAYNNSSVIVSDEGHVLNLYAHDTTKVAISGIPTAGVTYLYAYDDSNINISGGWIVSLYARGNSDVAISAGRIDGNLSAAGDSSVAISGGGFGGLSANGHSSVDISDGMFSRYLSASDYSTVTISGGILSGGLRAGGKSTITLVGYDFRAGAGLSLEGQTVLGTGILSGKWFDDSEWITIIHSHDTGATILAIPEPATLTVLAFGGLVVLCRRRRRTD